MRSFRIAACAACAVGATGGLGVYGCTSGPPNAEPTPIRFVDAAVTDHESPTPLADAGAGDASDASLGTVPLVDVTDTPCAAPGGSPVAVSAVDGGAPPLTGLSRVGARWAAYGATNGGLLLFDDTGVAVTPAPARVAKSVNVIASEGSTAGVAGLDKLDIRFGRFDDQGSATVAPMTLATSPVGGLAVGGAAGTSVVVWNAGNAMHARAVGASGSPAGAAFDFGAGFAPSAFSAAIAPAPQGFAIAWSADFGADSYRSFFALLTPTAASAPAVEVVGTTAYQSIVGMAAQSSGYVLLLDTRAPTPAVSLVFVDSTGKLRGAARRLLGVEYGLAVASNGAEFAVLATRATGETELRSFNAAGTPLAPWVCLATLPSDGFGAGGLAASGAGYASVFRAADGTTTLTRVDHLGTGSP